MEAMILAAGAGTRLRPLTDQTPKALLVVRGKPLLAHVMERLVAAGVTRIIVNVHHHADQIAAYLADHHVRGVGVVLSPEPDGPYDTGGGLLAAAPYFTRRETFLLHNVDVLSSIPLDALLAAHRGARERWGKQVVATVAVQDRDADRRLLFDERGLMGWENRRPDGTGHESERAREPAGAVRHRAFTGIHAIEPAIFDLADRPGRFSIIAWYLDLVRRGFAILPFEASACAWMDVGTSERLHEAEAQGEERA